MKIILTIIFLLLFFRLFSIIVFRILAHRIKKAGRFSETRDEEGAKMSPKHKKKIIEKNEGDYVDFEEMDRK